MRVSVSPAWVWILLVAAYNIGVNWFGIKMSARFNLGFSWYPRRPARPATSS